MKVYVILTNKNKPARLGPDEIGQFLVYKTKAMAMLDVMAENGEHIVAGTLTYEGEK